MHCSVAKFTAEQAFEDSANGDPIMLTMLAAKRICQDHVVDFVDYLADSTLFDTKIDAADLLAWLGY